MGSLKKRSVNLAGHATSLALEPEFWAALERIAKGSKAVPAAARRGKRLRRFLLR